MSPEPTGVATAPAPTVFRPAALAAGAAESERAHAARAAGYAAGWAAGARAAAEAAAEQQHRIEEEHTRAEAERDAEIARAARVLERAAQALVATTTPAVTDATRTLHATALALAEAVLRRELTPGPDSARALLDRALDVPAELGLHTVRLSPADHAHVTALVADHPGLLPRGVELVADPALAVGDAVSEHAAGYLDARIDQALDRARRALEGTL